LNKNISLHNIIDIIKEFDREISHLQFSSVARSTLGFIQNQLGIEHTSITLLQKDIGGFLLYEVGMDIKGIESGKFLPFEKTVLSEVINHTEPLYRPNIKKWQTEYEVDKILLEAGLRSDFLIPLIVNGQCIGTLNVASMKTNGIGEKKRFAIQFFAPRLAQTLQNAIYVDSLLESEKRYRNLVESIEEDHSIYVHDTNGIFTYLSPSITNILGYTPKEFMTHYSTYLTDAPINKEVILHTDLSIRGIKQPPYEVEIYHKDRSIRWLSVNEVPVFNSSNQVVAVQGIAHDITERKRAEHALLEEEKRYKRLTDSVTDYIFTVIVGNGRAVSTTHGPACVAVTGYTSDEYNTDQYLWYKMVHEEDRESVIKHADRVIAGKSIEPLEHRIIHKNGDVKWVRNTPVPRYDREGKLIAYDGLIVDITERKKAEEALRESEKKLQSLYNSMTELMALHEVVYDRSGKAIDYRILDCNPAFTLITGIQRDKAIGALASQLYGSGEAPYLDIYARVTETGESTQFDTYFSPMKKHFSISVFSPGKGFFATVASDISDRKLVEEEHRKLQEQLLHSQKMEAVGQLAGGVAHDFNNILTAIIGYANIIKMKMKNEDPLKAHLDQILRASERGAHLTQSLLAFSRKQFISPKPVDLNIIIKNVQKLLSRVITEDIELKVILDENNLTIMADSGQMEQILMNLATNAKDAMPQGGRLIIKTGITAIDEQFIKQYGFGEIGEYALLSVVDTGTGMDEKTQDRVFEPFFTTKEVGRGTGLGLAMVYGAIKQNSGYITLLSEPDKGTTFNIYIPLIKTITQKEESSQIVELIKGGTETILIAEDDESLRELAASVLREFGYSVIEAEDGHHAIVKFKEHKEKVKLLILDVIMPKINGKEVYDEIKKSFPEIKVLFVSGYTSELVQKKGIIDSGLNFLPKPLLPNQLLKKVRGILDEEVKKI
jgi:PAS domain S-box-containing protein